MKTFFNIVKKDIVLTVAFLLAVVSAFFVKPSLEYINYIDFRTIGLLFSLMAVVAGFTNMGIMRKMAEYIVNKAKTTTGLVLLLWSMCFFMSMVITNDVALLTFVPLTLTVLSLCDKKELIIYTIVLQTVAANMGSMLTPMGNPQNLYIYNYFNVSVGDFFDITLPVIILSFVLLLISTLFVRKENLTVSVKGSTITGGKLHIAMYVFLSIACVLAVLKLIDYRIAVVAVASCLLIFDRAIFKSIDWLLLLTFCSFFVLVGNIERIEFISNFINDIIYGREFVVSLLASQVISNVPSAVMLSGFTDNYTALILGTDIGGLGSIVASLASLISFKLYSNTDGANTKRYMLVFTAVNIAFLIVLFIFAFIKYLT